MLRPLTGVLLALLIAAAGCQQESPSQPDKPVAKAANGNGGNGETAVPVEIDPTHPVDVQVTKPSRENLVYTITLPGNISPDRKSTRLNSSHT